MIRINLAFYYDVGSTINPLTKLVFINGGLTQDCLIMLYAAQATLKNLIDYKEIYSSYKAAKDLLYIIKSIIDDHQESKKITDYRLYDVLRQARNFEAAYKAEIQVSNSYSVTSKGGYDISILTQMPNDMFPSNLSELVPETKHDIEHAAKCLAFENSTAASFHLMRILESVIQKYWSLLSHGSKKPKNRTLGGYLSTLQNYPHVDKKLLATLRQIKDLHRNPIAHPDKNLTIEEAIDMYGIIRSAISSLLENINKINVKNPT